MELLQKPEYCYETWFGTLADGVTLYTFISGSICSDFAEDAPYFSNTDTEWQEDYMGLTASQAVALYEAICQDIAAGSTVPDGFQNQASMDALGSIDFGCYVKDYDPAMGSYTAYTERTGMNYITVTLYSTMEHTIACLEEMGFAFAGW